MKKFENPLQTLQFFIDTHHQPIVAQLTREILETRENLIKHQQIVRLQDEQIRELKKAIEAHRKCNAWDVETLRLSRELLGASIAGRYGGEAMRAFIQLAEKKLSKATPIRRRSRRLKQEELK